MNAVQQRRQPQYGTGEKQTKGDLRSRVFVMADVQADMLGRGIGND